MKSPVLGRRRFIVALVGAAGLLPHALSAANERASTTLITCPINPYLAVSAPESVRQVPSLVQLPDGRVQLLGGLFARTEWLFEFFHADTLSWSRVGPQVERAPERTAFLQSDGTIFTIESLYYGEMQASRFDPQRLSVTSVALDGAPTDAGMSSLRRTVQLQSGELLVFGARRAARLDPRTLTWRPTTPKTTTAQLTAVRLLDGRVLVSGGVRTLTVDSWDYLPDAEIYDPATNGWQAIPPLRRPRDAISPVVLADGRVLVAGGGGWTMEAGVEIYDPVRNLWHEAAPLPTPRAGYAALTLDDGQVLLTGGYSDLDPTFPTLPGSPPHPGPPDRTSLRYDAQSNRWHSTSALAVARADHSMIQLRDGRVFIVGGWNNVSWPPRKLPVPIVAELYYPLAERFCPLGPLPPFTRPVGE